MAGRISRLQGMLLRFRLSQSRPLDDFGGTWVTFKKVRLGFLDLTRRNMRKEE